MQKTSCTLLVLLLFFSSTLVSKQAYSPYPPFSKTPKYEVRAVWLTTIGGLDWPKGYNAEQQKKQLCELLDKLKAANINTILLQTRVRATTIYPSLFEPFDGCITGHPGKTPNYDPLAFAIEECHKRGMELHCWIVTIPVGKWNGFGCKRLRTKMPHLLKKIGDEGYMNPEKAETADYLAKLCVEVAEKYDIDGIHLDYIRYPETWSDVRDKNEARRNITRIVETINHRVKSVKRYIKISCSPIGKYADLTRYNSKGWNAYQRVYQDAQEWLRQGLMDMIFPMMYFRGNNFYPFAIDWNENSYGRTVVPGLGIYFLSPKEKNWSIEDITRELEVLRSQDMGFSLFRTQFLIDDTKGIYSFLSDKFTALPALIPPMTWESSTVPHRPSNLSVKKTNEHTIISWEGDDDILYNVYASRFSQPDINDANCLVATRLRGKSLIIKNEGKDVENFYYAVTATDRYGNESLPLIGPNIGDSQLNPECSFILVDDNLLLDLSQFAKYADMRHLMIKNLQQQVLYATTPDKNNCINVSKLKDGIYSLNTINKKSVSHRLCYFMVKRK